MSSRKTLLCNIGLAFLFAFFSLSFCHAEETNPVPPFSPDDKVLILAPHPDDEAIGTAGVIQRALKANAKVRVVLFTNGDNNELSFIVYEKRLTFARKEFLHMGEVRRKETLLGVNSLGLNQDDVVFLGYPDFGTMEILTKYWGDTEPYLSMFPRVTKVSYPEAQSFNAPYVGESILKDIQRILQDFKPNKIFVSHPDDTNVDHQALYLFLRICLWDLEGQIKQPEVYPYIIHVPSWPEPRGFHPELGLNPPDSLHNSEIRWQRLELPNEEIQKKYDAIKYYKSQIEYDPAYLFTFARKNELFGDYPILTLKPQQEKEEIQWENLEFADTPDRISDLAYARHGDNLFVRIRLNRYIAKMFDITVFLLGYSKEVEFSNMPKIHLYADTEGLRVRDKRQALFIKDIKLEDKKKELIFRIPLSVLGRPRYILACAKTHAHDLSLDETSWRILAL